MLPALQDLMHHLILKDYQIQFVKHLKYFLEKKDYAWVKGCPSHLTTFWKIYGQRDNLLLQDFLGLDQMHMDLTNHWISLMLRNSLLQWLTSWLPRPPLKKSDSHHKICPILIQSFVLFFIIILFSIKNI